MTYNVFSGTLNPTQIKSKVFRRRRVGNKEQEVARSEQCAEHRSVEQCRLHAQEELRQAPVSVRVSL